MSPINRPEISNLDDIGIATETDKNSKYHNYLNFYAEYFEKYRTCNFCLLEIGIFKGASIRMWERYFPNASIYGLDIVPWYELFERATALCGNAVDPTYMNPLLDKIRPFILIEDASHRYSHQIKIFEISFPYLRPGGYYICEDIQVCFGEYRKLGYKDQDLDSVTYFSQLALLAANGGIPGDNPQLNSVSADQIKLSKSIDYIIFRYHCVFIKKKS